MFPVFLIRRCVLATLQAQALPKEFVIQVVGLDNSLLHISQRLFFSTCSTAPQSLASSLALFDGNLNHSFPITELKFSAVSLQLELTWLVLGFLR